MLSLFTAEKSFADPFVGSARLNRLGLHPLRVRMAQAMRALRRAGRVQGDAARALVSDGLAIVPDCLPAEDFAALAAEAGAEADRVRAATPWPQAGSDGFGAPQRHDWGLDRFDGGTLNRFITLSAARTPRALAFARHPILSTLSRAAVGLAFAPERLTLYETVHGRDPAHGDIQGTLHRDTFFPAFKFWFFLRDVRLEDGPFVYVRRSQRADARRLAWERVRAETAAARRAAGERAGLGGAFRIAADELEALNLPPAEPVPVRANTLVAADVFGFHARAAGTPGATRLALYGTLRPWPFLPVGR